MAGSSRVPAVIDGLVALIRDTLPAAAVLDGPQPYKGTKPLVVTVGDDGDSDNPRGGQSALEWAALGHYSRDETISIPSAIMARTGTAAGTAAVRQAVYDALAVIEAALVADPTIGGTVRVAWVDSADLLYRQLQRGLAAVLVFTVHAEARLTTS
jgi:hypothetical protein